MSYVTRASKFKHVFGEPSKQGFTNVAPGNPEGNGVSGSAKFIGLSWKTAGGGAFAVLPLDKPSRLPATFPKIIGHSGQILDADFSPFDDHQVATASEDLSVRLWQIPEGGLTEDMSTPLVSLDGHQKKVHIVQYHRSAQNILASAAYDNVVKIWDASRGTAVLSVENYSDTIGSLAWTYDGKAFVTTCKDKQARLVDARTGETALEWLAHEGTKPSRAVWLGAQDHVATLGFDRQSGRQIMLWDPRKMGGPLRVIDMDVSAGALMPMYDEDTGVLFVAGKGENSVSYFEVAQAEKADNLDLFRLSAWAGSKPQKGICMLPKRAVDVGRCEIARLVRNTGDALEVVSMIVPRKASDFQSDLYPNTAGPVPALSAEAWVAGENKPPTKISLKPGDASAADVNATPRTAVKTVFQLQKELEEKDALIAQLQKEIAALKLQVHK